MLKVSGPPGSVESTARITVLDSVARNSSSAQCPKHRRVRPVASSSGAGYAREVRCFASGYSLRRLTSGVIPTSSPKIPNARNTHSPVAMASTAKITATEAMTASSGPGASRRGGLRCGRGGVDRSITSGYWPHYWFGCSPSQRLLRRRVALGRSPASVCRSAGRCRLRGRRRCR